MNYRIEDEPRPGGLAQWVVDPLWPLFAIMFGGAALSWGWFVWNGFAVGSPTKNRELALAIGGLVGSFVLILTIAFLANGQILGTLGIQYALVGLTVWKLGISYWLYMLQGRSFHLYQYFGGTVKSGFMLAFIGGYFFRKLLAESGLGDFLLRILI